MMYKKLITALTGLLLLFSTAAQQFTPQTINNGGSSKTAGGIILEDALGGLLVNTVSTPVFTYTQDFLQPDAGITTVLPIINNVTLSSGSGIDIAGATFINGNIMLEFTAGEFASITLNSTGSMLTQGILQPFSIGTALPVTGLEFYAKRINSNQVQLDWKTLQEINNKGFHIERKKETENNFADMGFVSSNANGGNSSFPIQYQKLDNNNFSGITYYRLKLEDIDGRSTYSVVRMVKGDMSKQLSLQVWPVPAVGFFNVRVNGLDKNDLLQVVDVNGRLVKQFIIQNQTQLQISGLPAGTYFVKLASDKTVGQKVILQ
jgi:Secretion system C-terminal sorting domain